MSDSAGGPSLSTPIRGIQQVLWIRVGALGDLLIATAALEKTFERFPGADVWVMGDHFWLELLEPGQWPRLNGVIIRRKDKTAQLYVPGSDKQWKRDGEPRPLSYFYRRCQATVNLRIESYRFAWGPFFFRVPVRIGSCPWPMKWLYTHWSPWLGKEPQIHERDWYVKVVEAPERRLFPLGRTAENRRELATATDRPKLGLPSLREQNWASVTKLLQKYDSRASSPELAPVAFGRYWLVNPTSSRLEKAWPAEKFREFCLSLKPKLASHGRRVLVIGAPNESEWLSQVAGNDFQIIQPPTLGELIDIVKGAELLVTNTSSVQFIAAGTKTPTVTLMGRASPVRWGPVGAKDLVVQGHFDDSTHLDLFEEERLAYASIGVDEVLAACEKIVNL